MKVCRVVRRVVRLNLKKPKPRVIALRVLPFLVVPPHDVSAFEQMAAVDTLSLALQVGMVLVKIS